MLQSSEGAPLVVCGKPCGKQPSTVNNTSVKSFSYLPLPLELLRHPVQYVSSAGLQNCVSYGIPKCRSYCPERRQSGLNGCMSSSAADIRGAHSASRPSMSINKNMPELYRGKVNEQAVAPFLHFESTMQIQPPHRSQIQQRASVRRRRKDPSICLDLFGGTNEPGYLFAADIGGARKSQASKNPGGPRRIRTPDIIVRGSTNKGEVSSVLHWVSTLLGSVDGNPHLS